MPCLLRSVEVMPSIITCCLAMGSSHASHISPSAGPPYNLWMLSNGRRPSRSFSRTSVRIASCIDLRLWLAPLLIPEREAIDVHLNRHPTAIGGGNALDHERADDQPGARSALFSVTWTDPESRDSVQRQTSVPQFLTDERTNRIVFHGLSGNRREQMPNSPEVSAPESVKQVRPGCRQLPA